MSGRTRSQSKLSPSAGLSGGSAAVGQQAPSLGNSFIQSMMNLTPVGPMVNGVEGLTALGGLFNDHENVGKAQSTASDLRSLAGFTNAMGVANGMQGMPGMGPITSAFGLMNTGRALDDGQEHGWNLERGFNLANGVATTIGPWLPGVGPALAASWGFGTTVGKHLDRGSEAAARKMAGPDGDARGLSSRLADRGASVDSYLDSALTGILSEENADLAGDVLGGAFTVGQMLTPALHYDIVDSFTGGGATKAKNWAGDKASEAWDWATDW
ncbi:MAG: hypothetical protein R3F61_36825 [Myxococcota bacterium]